MKRAVINPILSSKWCLVGAVLAAMFGCGPNDSGNATSLGASELNGRSACIEIAVQCPDGQEVADVDGDGCALECRAAAAIDAGSACIIIAVQCPEGQVVADVDGDGCALECR
jgi:hypothetical protein